MLLNGHSFTESIDLQVTVVLNKQCKGFDKSCGQREIWHTQISLKTECSFIGFSFGGWSAGRGRHFKLGFNLKSD